MQTNCLFNLLKSIFSWSVPWLHVSLFISRRRDNRLGEEKNRESPSNILSGNEVWTSMHHKSTKHVFLIGNRLCFSHLKVIPIFSFFYFLSFSLFHSLFYVFHICIFFHSFSKISFHGHWVIQHAYSIFMHYILDPK